MFDAASGAEISRLDHEAAVTAVAFSPEGATGGHRQRRRQRAGVRRGDRRRDLPPGPPRARSVAVAFSPDGARVATGSGDGSARVFDAATGAEISRLDHERAVYAVAFSPDGTRVATGSG